MMPNALFPSSLLSVALCIVTLTGGVSTVRAQPNPDGATEARRLFVEGKKRYDARQYMDALDLLLRARARLRRASLALMLARCYRRLERPDAALRYFNEHAQLWVAENPGKASPHAAEVTEQIGALGEVVSRVQRAEALLDKGDAVGALPLLHDTLRASGWARIHTGLARCYAMLDRPNKAGTHLKVAAGLWEAQRVAWRARHPERPLPDEQVVKQALQRIEQVERILSRHARGDGGSSATPDTGSGAGTSTGSTTSASDPEASSDTGPTDPPDQPTTGTPPTTDPPERSALWLALGITGAALAVGGEVMAWVSYARATGYYGDEPEYDRYRAMTVAGHVAAGAGAVLAGVSFYLYATNGKAPPAAAVLPLTGPTFAGIAGTFTF